MKSQNEQKPIDRKCQICGIKNYSKDDTIKLGNMHWKVCKSCLKIYIDGDEEHIFSIIREKLKTT